MSRVESALVGVVVAVLCPASLFVVLWWGAASLKVFRVAQLPDSWVAAAAFTGLAAGLVLDVVYVKRWAARFYDAGWWLLGVVYLFWSAVWAAVFMGLPVGNVAWGVVAGLYVGRRLRRAGSRTDAFSRAARRAGMFTAAVTGAWALPIGLLSLREPAVAEVLQGATGLGRSVVTGPAGVALVAMACAGLMAVQFWCTRAAAALAFRVGGRPG